MNNLQYFQTLSFIEALRRFFTNLQVPVNYFDDKPAKPEDVLGEYYNLTKDSIALMDDVYVAGMVDDAAFANTKSAITSAADAGNIHNDYDGLLIFGVTLKKRKDNLLPTRTQLAEITRAFNRAFPFTPVTVVFRYNEYISLANAERHPYKRDNKDGEKIGKVNLLKDIFITKPHRGHTDILAELSINKTGTKAVTTFKKLYTQWQKVLSTQTLNTRFYLELFHWYLWAKRHIQIPAPPASETQTPVTLTSIFTIRLLTRILFVWFVKEKKLIPAEAFDKAYVSNILKRFDAEGTLNAAGKKDTGDYYKAILQNLFFATLNTPMDKDPAVKEERRQFLNNTKNTNGYNDQHLDQTKYRHEDLLKNPDALLQLFKEVPFLNGGLFECLDYRAEDNSEMRYDGFSSTKSKQAIVPDMLFFSPEQEHDLSADFDDAKKKNVRIRGLIETLNSYKFTIAENTPLEEEVALDPELLGKVFENLLASYNPETKTTARKQTGSFYTPREIVNYMADESLKAYLLQKLMKEPEAFLEAGKTQPDMFGNAHRKGQLKIETTITDASDRGKQEQHEQALKQLFDAAHFENTFSAPDCNLLIEALSNCRILDPACGSGAFPMGVLHRMVNLLARLDPNNKAWKQAQLNKAESDLESAKKMQDDTIKEAATKQAEERIEYIKESFENTRHELDYTRKLFLIENCIYGIDIQQIAVQIAKLRFFISLMSEQQVDDSRPNRNILSMPNLETKFVAANTLVALEKNVSSKKGTVGALEIRSDEVIRIERSVKELRKQIFFTRSFKQKKKLKGEEKTLRETLKAALMQSSWGEKSAAQAADWDPFDQLHSAPFYDTETMFGFTEGFDIVIGNPPWGAKLESNEIKHLLEKFPIVPTKIKDSYLYFLIKSLSITTTKGFLALIIPNTWLLINHADKFRKYILQFKIKEIDDYGDGIFEQATVESSTLFIINQKEILGEVIIKRFKRNKLITETSIDKSMWLKDSLCRVLLDITPANRSIIDKLERSTEPFSVNNEIIWGIKPYQVGYGKPAQTEDDLKNRVFHSTLKRGEDWYPILVGSNVNRYSINYAFQEFIRYGVWLMYPSNFKVMQSEKILLRQTSDILRAAFDDKKYLAQNSLFIIYSRKYNLKFLTALLNSSLLNFIYKIKNPQKGKVFAEIKPSVVKELPLPKVEPKNHQLFITLVNQIIQQKQTGEDTTALEAKIDQIVYALYNLTYEEACMIEGNTTWQAKEQYELLLHQTQAENNAS